MILAKQQQQTNKRTNAGRFKAWQYKRPGCMACQKFWSVFLTLKFLIFPAHEKKKSQLGGNPVAGYFEIKLISHNKPFE